MFKRRKPDELPGMPPAPGSEATAPPPGPAPATDAARLPPSLDPSPPTRRPEPGFGVPPFRPAAKEAPAMGRSPFPAPPSPATGMPAPGMGPQSGQGTGQAPGQSGLSAPPRPGGPPRPGREPAERRTLVVGRGISVQGTVSDAERLIVEGTFEASIVHATELVIAPGGMFKGEVEVEDTEVAGTIDGTLTARGNLVVRSTGKVLGTARCRRLQVEDGGQITGRIEMITSPAAEPPRPAPEPTPAA